MQLQFDKSDIRYLKKALGDIRSAELTEETRLSEGMPDIGRVLTGWGQVMIRSKEWSRDEISISGGVMVWTLYIPEDGTEPRSVESWIPFQLRWDVDPELRDGPILVCPLLRFVDCRGTSARKIMHRIGLSVGIRAMTDASAEIFTPGQVPGDVQLHKAAYPVRLPVDAGEKVFTVDEELTLPEGSAAVEKIIAATLQPELTENKFIGDKLVFKGNATLHLRYRCPEGKIHSLRPRVAFSQYAQLKQIYDDGAGAEICLIVTSLETDRMDEGRLRLKASLVGQYVVDREILISLTEDAYSPRREVELEREGLQLPSVLEDRQETLTAEQTLTGQTGQPVDVTFLSDFPRQRRTAEGVQIELPGMFQLLYYAEDGSLNVGNLRWEGSVDLAADSDVSVQLSVLPVGSATASRHGENIGVTAQLQLRSQSIAHRQIPMVTALELGELKEPDPGRPSLVLCRAGEDSLWDIAKRCGSTVDAIGQANRLTGEPGAERMLLIPVL